MGNQDKIVKFKKRKKLNIGIVVFLILFIYIAINVYLYFTKDQLIIYEVQEGGTALDNRVNALILRQEKLVDANQSGYVLYYQKDGARVAKNESVYSITDNEIYNENASDSSAVVLSDKNDSEIKHEIRTFQNSFSNDDFSKVYDFKDNVQSTVLDILNNSLVSDEKGNSFSGSTYKSSQSGIITYYKDNYESVTPDHITSDMFDKKNYKKTGLRTTEKISQNTSVYKIVTSEEWNLVISLTTDQYKQLKDKNTVTITVIEDNLNLSANMEIKKLDSGYYAVLTMNKDMANYLNERYLDVDINMSSMHGLKIPNSSIIERNFYKVPMSYFTQGGESKDWGVSKEVYGKNGKVTYPFVATDIYYKDDNYGYIDTQQFPAGTVIQSPDKEEKYTLSKTKRLVGVYNVNYGYAVFKRIEILYKDKEYTIVKDNTVNGLSAYDHIVLDGNTAVEQKIIY